MDKAKIKKITLLAAAIIALIAYILMCFTPLGVLALKKENQGHGMFDTMLLYGEDDAYEILDGTTEKGLKLYLQTHIFDYIFMVALFVAQMLLLDVLTKRNNLQKLKLLYLFPVGQLVSDLLENILLDVMVSVYPKKLPGLVGAINCFTLTKWYFVLGFIISVALIVGICRKRKTDSPCFQSKDKNPAVSDTEDTEEKQETEIESEKNSNK